MKKRLQKKSENIFKKKQNRWIRKPGFWEILIIVKFDYLEITKLCTFIRTIVHDISKAKKKKEKFIKFETACSTIKQV